MIPVAAYTPLFSVAVLLGAIAAPAGAEPPPCPRHASALCGAPQAGHPGGADNRADRDLWDELAYSYGAESWDDSRPAAWDEDFDAEEYLAEHAGWTRSPSSDREAEAPSTRAEPAASPAGPGREPAVAALKKPAPESVPARREAHRSPADRDRRTGFRAGERLIARRQEVIRDYAAYGLEPPMPGDHYIRMGDTVLVVETATQRIVAQFRLPGRREMAWRY